MLTGAELELFVALLFTPITLVTLNSRFSLFMFCPAIFHGTFWSIRRTNKGSLKIMGLHGSRCVFRYLLLYFLPISMYTSSSASFCSWHSRLQVLYVCICVYSYRVKPRRTSIMQLSLCLFIVSPADS